MYTARKYSPVHVFTSLQTQMGAVEPLEQRTALRHGFDLQ